MFGKLFSAGSRRHYLAIAGIATLFNFFALYLQHIEGLPPCVTCIDIRVGLWGVTLFSLLAATTIRPLLMAWAIGVIAAFCYVGNMIYGSMEELYWSSGLFASCNLRPAIADYLPVDEWLPSMFAVKGMCGKTFWTIAGIELEVVQSTFYAISALVVFHGIGIVNGVFQRFAKPIPPGSIID